MGQGNARLEENGSADMNWVYLFRTSAGRWATYRWIMWHMLPPEDRKRVRAKNAHKWIGKYA